MKFLNFLILILLLNILIAKASNLDSLVEYSWENKYESLEETKKFYKEILPTVKEQKNVQLEAKLFSYLGIIEDLNGNSARAIEWLFKAIKIQEEHQFLKDLSFSYNNLGVAYFYQFSHNQALSYYKKSLEIDETLNDEKGVAGTLINIGVLYTYMDSLDKSKEFYLEALEVYQRGNDSLGIESVFNNLAKISTENKDYKEAINFYHKSLEYAKGSKNPESLFTTYYSLSTSYLALNQLDTALFYANKATNLAQKFNLRERLQWGYDILSEIYEAKNEYENSFNYLKLYTHLKDTLVNETKNAKIAEMQVLYESEKKDKQIAEIALEKEQEETLRISKEKERNLFLALALATVVILVFLAYAYYTKQKTGILLEQRNKAIQENLNQKETMIGEIHHRIKNNLQIISNIFDLQARTLKDKEALKAINDSRNKVNAMAIIHQKLYQQNDIYGIKIDDYIKNLSESIIETFNVNTNKIYLHYEIEPIYLHIDTSIPLGLIITEILTNSIKYAFSEYENGNIFIRLIKKLDYLELEIKDDGIGFEYNPTKDNGNSFGIKMIKSLCRQLKADFEVIDNKGTIYLLKIKNFKLSD